MLNIRPLFNAQKYEESKETIPVCLQISGVSVLLVCVHGLVVVVGA